MRIAIGQGSCGLASGAEETMNALLREINTRGLQNVHVEKTGCIGLCWLEPIMDVYTESDGLVARYVNATADKVPKIVEKHLVGGKPAAEYCIKPDDASFLERQSRIVLRNCGLIDPERVESYVAVGGYAAARRVLTRMTPEEVIGVIKDAGLRGRGGAGFPTWFKWDAARRSEGAQKYMVCNADEGDPGAFMDRSVLEGDPHSVIEGMLIGGYAIGATEGVVYVRAEYPLAIARLQSAISQAQRCGYLGENIFGSGFTFRLKIKAGAGAFVCGEETALIASLEGGRGMPRVKPPFPAQKGYWKCPTNINNVETLANVPWILYNGARAFAAYGTEESRGTKVFALAGKVKRCGLAEVPMGVPLRDVIFSIGGGIKDGGTFKAVQLGGPSGGCLPESLLDTPVDYAAISATGAIVGSGGMIVLDQNTCMVDLAQYFFQFIASESCGKCNYCRIGSKRMLEILERITKGEGRSGDIPLLEELCEKVRSNAMCGLGQTAPNPVLTTLRYFRHEYEEHIFDHSCGACVCQAMVKYEITESCKGCAACLKRCPVHAIQGEAKALHTIDQALCIHCGKCVQSCKFSAIVKKPGGKLDGTV